ncbi:MAG: BMP family ABC transporter substrate-binding protein, partial [Minwuiales bacterium]|nr:BMP family ABC transporter substrate-binding protein [Minwuiales bacterium]
MSNPLKNIALAIAACAAVLLLAGQAQAEKIKVAGIYTVPVQQKWVGTLHRALSAAEEAGEIDYSFSEKVPNTDYVRVMREYAESGVKLIVGEAFGISREARKVADDYPEVAFVVGDPGGPHGSNFSVFDNWIHEPCYLMGIIAGSMTKTNKIGMVGGYPIGEVNRL